MSFVEVAEMLQDLGGYGVAGLMWWFWRQADTERKRYRDLQEKMLGEIPLLTESLKELTDAVDQRNQRSLRPRTQ